MLCVRWTVVQQCNHAHWSRGVCLMLQQQRWVVALETTWPTKPKLSTASLCRGSFLIPGLKHGQARSFIHFVTYLPPCILALFPSFRILIGICTLRYVLKTLWWHIYTRVRIDAVQSGELVRTCCVAQGTLLSALQWPEREGNPRKRGYTCMYSWFM